jgi:hypothetical protein
MPTLAELYAYLGRAVYRRKVTITAGSAGMPSDYQIKIVFNTASLIAVGKMRSDCGDIRFTKADGTLLPYWIEPDTINSANTVIWVRIPDSLGANQSLTIYMWYGNPYLTSAASGGDTFLFFDDFESYPDGADINGLGGWVTRMIGGSGEAKVRLYSGWKHLHLSSTNNGTVVEQTKTVTNAGYSLRLREVADDWDEALVTAFSDGQLLSSGDIYNGYDVAWWGYSGAYTRIRKWSGGSATILASMSDSDVNGRYHKLEFAWYGSKLYAYRDEYLLLTATDTTYTSRSVIHIHEWAGSSRYIDYVFLRRFVDPAPTVTVGTEEEWRKPPDLV